MSAQITGLAQAQRNANDGISVAQTAEGALNQINDNVQRIRELTVQAQNGTNSQDDLQSIQDEVNQRLAEIDRISQETSFNGVDVLAENRSLSIQVGANDGQTISVGLQKINSSTLGIGSFNVTGPADTNTTTDDIDTVAWSTTVASSITAEKTAVERHYGDTTSIDTLTITPDTSFAADLSSRLGIAEGSITGAPGTVQVDDNGNLFATIVITATNQAEVDNLAARGLQVDGTNATTFYVALDPANGTVTDTTLDFSMSGASLDIGAMTQGGTVNPLKNLDDALNKIDSLRSELGAVQNRFEDAISNLSTNETNLSAARSRIEDADYAVEVANMTRAQILQQAGTSVLAQANQIPQNVLSLLG